uniref:Isoamylase 1ic-like isoform X2 n=1 Tax=Rhizophora mucronata TaxID=61149 RepID=A0A2P2KYU1_RHIMU
MIQKNARERIGKEYYSDYQKVKPIGRLDSLDTCRWNWDPDQSYLEAGHHIKSNSAKWLENNVVTIFQ